MAAQYCPKCGASNPPSAAFCQYCGNALPSAPAAPLASAGMSGPPPSNAPPWGAPAYGAAPYGGAAYPPAAPPPPPRRRLLLWIIVGFVVLILVVGAILIATAPPAVTYNVVVTGINFASPDNVCDLAGATGEGFNATTNSSVELSFYVSGPNDTSGSGTMACNITTIEADTAGFTVSGANVPLNIPANASPLLSFDVETPVDPFTGVLTLVLT